MENKGGIPPKATLTIRLLIGVYLIYIDYQIFSDVMAREGISKYIMLAIMVFFIIAGAILIITSARSLLGAGGGSGDDAPSRKDRQEDEDKTP